mmetsp:Transcript_111/g.402  ORF Transcript_111/g.402 Transcript_111/m.402 type:complete len:258 (+) Transcript_111:108-881(+)
MRRALGQVRVSQERGRVRRRRDVAALRRPRAVSATLPGGARPALPIPAADRVPVVVVEQRSLLIRPLRRHPVLLVEHAGPAAAPGHLTYLVHQQAHLDPTREGEESARDEVRPRVVVKAEEDATRRADPEHDLRPDQYAHVLVPRRRRGFTYRLVMRADALPSFHEEHADADGEHEEGHRPDDVRPVSHPIPLLVLVHVRAEHRVQHRRRVHERTDYPHRKTDYVEEGTEELVSRAVDSHVLLSAELGCFILAEALR